MDVRRLLAVVLQLVLAFIHLSEPLLNSCPVGSLWNVNRKSCVDCFGVCPHPRDYICLTRCLEAAAATAALRIKSVARRHRRDGIHRTCGDIICQTDEYCDMAVRGCTSCSIICDFHKIQGTTDRCTKLCPEYFGNQRTERPDQTDDNAHPTIVVITSVSLSILGTLSVALAVLAVRYRKKLCKCKASSSTHDEEKKRPLPCSQEGENDLINSRTPLTRQTGPIAEEKNFPEPETAADEYKGNLGEELGFPDVACPYRELDGPSTHSTIPKQRAN